MRKNLARKIEIPSGVNVLVNGNGVSVKSGNKEIKRTFDFGKVEIKVVDGKIELSAKNATRRESKMIGTIWAHLKNMIKGMAEDFVYTLEVCNVHFPMNVKAEKDKVIIKSFLGEKVDRVAEVLPNVVVKVSGSQVTVSSFDVDAAGQTAANIEQVSKLTGRDRRVFQDGIFITNKCGVAI